MKAFGLVLLALFVGFVGYQFAYPKLNDWAQFQNYEHKAPTPEADDTAKIAATKSSKLTDKLKTTKTSSEMEAPKPLEMPKLEPAPEPPKKEVAVKLPEPEKKKPEDDFVPPTFKTIDEITKGWTAIPKTIFPRPVKVMKDIEFVANINGNKIGTKLPAGGQVHAIDQEGPNLTVAPTPTSPARVQVPLEDTDLKEVLSQGYEAWKVQMTEFRRKEFLAKLNGPKTTTAASTPSGPQRADKPEKAPDGTYPILIASMKAGQVTEITPANIKKWGDPQLQKDGKKETWTIAVNYTTKTMFGDFDTEAKATIVNGKVESWKYTGSGEVVP